MKFYQAVNEWFSPLPVKPFTSEQDAVAHIRAVQETSEETFYIIELNVTSTILPVRKPAET